MHVGACKYNIKENLAGDYARGYLARKGILLDNDMHVGASDVDGKVKCHHAGAWSGPG